MKNVLVLTGSPRKGGNSELMADAFIKGAVAAGNRVTKYETAGRDIKGCRACNACYSKGKACVFDDDFNGLAPLLEETEVLVLVSPLYWYTFTAQIKAALDKMYALVVGERPLKLNEMVLLTCGGTGDEKDFEGIVRTYEIVTKYLEKKDAGQLVVPGVNDKRDIQKTDALARAEEMGKNI